MASIFDSHAHYDHEKYDEDREELLLGLADKNVTRVVNIASDIESCTSSLELAEKYDFIYATLGIHPHTASTLTKEVLHNIAETASHKKVTAIGEIGLDYYYDFSPRDTQREAFISQLSIAHDLKMPVVIHSRDATADTLEILKKYRPEGIVHCFSGSAEVAVEVQKLGLYIGFTGVVTFSNAKKAIEAVKMTDLSRLLIETDCPYMAPTPFRGKRCDSSMLSFVVDKMAEIKNVTPEEIMTRTFNNANTVYRIQN